MGTNTVRTNAGRQPPIHHRSAVTFTCLATPATPTLSDLGDTVGATILAATEYYCNIVAVGANYTTVGSSVGNVTTASDSNNTHAIRVTITPLTGATGYYVFFSANAAPLYCVFITAAQLAAGGARITAYNTLDALGAGGANTIDVWNPNSAITSGLGTSAANMFATAFYMSPDQLQQGIVNVAADLSAATNGTLVYNTKYYFTAIPGNRWGNAKQLYGTTSFALTCANDSNSAHAVRVTIPTIANAEYYDVFLSTAAAPLWVGRVTTAQLATGGARISAVGTVDASGGSAAGQVDVCLVGTGVACTAAPFATNTAWTPSGIQGTLTATQQIASAGFDWANATIKVAPSDFRAVPTGPSIQPFYVCNNSQGDWAAGTSVSTAAPWEVNSQVEVHGPASTVYLVGTPSGLVAGQSLTVDIWVELS